MRKENLENKIAVVTGAAGGIGRCITERLLSHGAFVFATDLNQKSLNRVFSGQKSEKLLTSVLDVTSRTSWLSLFRKVDKHPGEFSALFNNAGVLKPSFISEIDEKDIDFHLDINVKGTVIGSSLAAARFIRLKKGSIINIASLAGVAPVPGIALYSTSKFAVRGFSLALAQELKPFNVNVSVICPDAVVTPMLELQVHYKEAALTFSGSRFLQPSEIAEKAVGCIFKPKLEILVPRHRGMLAKMASLSPRLAVLLLGSLKRGGLKKQAEIKKKGLI